MDTTALESGVESLVKVPADSVPEKYKRFAGLLAEEVGDELRLVFYFDESNTELCMLREEMFGDDLLPRISKLRRRVLEDLTLTGSEFSEFFGEMQSCVSIHEDVAVLCFQEAKEKKGIIATIDYNGGLISVPN